MDVGKSFCAALGIDPSDVKAIDIHVGPGELPTFTVTHLVRSASGFDELCAVLETFTLIPKD